MPLADNFEMLSDIYVLPMNVTEVWAQIYSDEAPYSLEKSMLELGEVFHSQGTWGEPTDEFIKISGSSACAVLQGSSVLCSPAQSFTI